MINTINPISQNFITQADAIPGYSASQLLNDLLATQLELITYKRASELAHVTQTYICQLCLWGKLKKYGSGHRVRVNKFEVIRYFTLPDDGQKQ